MYKKLVPLIIIILIISAILGACESFNFGPVSGGDKNAVVYDNGGLAVKQGNFLYFINGYADYDTDPKANFFGDVLKGAIMRGEIVEGELKNVQTVVPKKVMSSSVNNGFSVFGEWIYYVSPGTGTNNKGEVLTDYIDFFRTKIDGTDTEKITTIKGNDTKFKFTRDALVYYLDNKLISIDISGKKFEETTIDEEVTSILFPENPVYDPASPSSPADYIFYVKDPESDYDLHNVVYVVNANGSGKKVLIDNTTYTSNPDDLNNIYTISLLDSSVTDNKLALYYTKKTVATVETQDKGLYGYEFSGTDFVLDKANEKCFSLKTATKIFPVSFEKGVFILDESPSYLAKYKGENDLVPQKTAYDFPSSITMLGVSTLGEKDYIYYINSDKVNRFPLDKSENAAIIISSKVKTGWSGPDFIDDMMFYVSGSDAAYEQYTYLADLASYNLSDNTAFKNAVIGQMTQDDIDAKEAAEEENDEE